MLDWDKVALIVSRFESGFSSELISNRFQDEMQVNVEFNGLRMIIQELIVLNGHFKNLKSCIESLMTVKVPIGLKLQKLLE